MTHSLKTWETFFSQVLSGEKTFELRKDNRQFAVGDTLILQEWGRDNGSYTGREIVAKITYKLHAADCEGLKNQYCVLGIKVEV
jgi:hypothetical protein